MSPTRLLPPLLLLVAPLATLAWRAEEVGRSAPAVLEPGVAYVVEPVAGEAVVELDPRTCGECLLVIGSLADGSESYDVVVEPADEALPLSAVRPFVLPQPSVEDRETRGVTPERPPSTGGGSPGQDERRSFHVHVTDGATDDGRHYAKVDARVVAHSTEVRVLLDENVSPGELAPGLVEEIVREIDDLLPRVEEMVGPPLDVDGDGTLAVLLTPWLGRLEGGRVSVDGFVRPSDFDTSVPVPFGDSADVLFLNPHLRPGRRLKAVLAHEAAHVAAISQRRRAWTRVAGPSSSGTVEEDWLNEAIAHVVEARLVSRSPNLVPRIRRFHESPASTPLVVPDYHAARLWRDDACRGATFGFLTHCLEVSEPDCLSRLAGTTDAGVRNVERATGRSFQDLFRSWSVAVARRTEPECLGAPTVRRQQIRLRGTATASVLVDPEVWTGRIRVAASPGARLQITLLPCHVRAESPKGSRLEE